MWDRTGQRVAGYYCDLWVEGVVESSRVKYGGQVQHTVRLGVPVRLFGSTRDVVLLDENELVHVWHFCHT